MTRGYVLIVINVGNVGFDILEILNILHNNFKIHKNLLICNIYIFNATC